MNLARDKEYISMYILFLWEYIKRGLFPGKYVDIR